MEDFRAWSALHALALAAIATATFIAIRVRRRRGGDAFATGPLERAIALGYLAMWIGTFTWLNTGPKHDPFTTWPLQLCHWVALVDAFVLVRPWRAARAVAYFCGLALCTQALITPSLVEGPAQWPFWFFWATHGMIVAVPVYDIVARDYRPSGRDFAIACAVALAYTGIALAINLATGWNYGFVGPSSPGHPTIVDLLGPWPRRLVFIVAIAFSVMALLYLPWWITRRRSPRARR